MQLYIFKIKSETLTTKQTDYVEANSAAEAIDILENKYNVDPSDIRSVKAVNIGPILKVNNG